MKNNGINFFTSRLILILCCFISFSNSANAGLFTLNDTTQVGSLSLSESFSSFYSYDSPNNASANTGYEEEGTVVMFLAEFEDELALITLIDAIGPSHSARRVKMALSDFNASDVVLVDDSGESTEFGFKWRWFSCCTDGMVYKITNNNSFDIDIDFYDVVGLSHFKFLSFTDGVSEAEENNIATSFSIQSIAMPTVFSIQATAIPEPTVFLLFLFSLLGLAISNLATKRLQHKS